MRLFLIRHAQSVNNALPEEQRVEDPALTPLGHRQAEALSVWLEPRGVTRLITSPFRRSLQTTEYIRRRTKLVPEVWIDLHEQGGCYSGYEPRCYAGRPGMTHLEIAAEFSDYVLDRAIDDAGWWKSQQYESHASARDRARRLLQRTLEIFGDGNETIAYVLHADFKRLLLSAMFPERGPDDGWYGIYNTAVSVIEITARSAKLNQYNSIEHLTSEMLST